MCHFIFDFITLVFLTGFLLLFIPLETAKNTLQSLYLVYLWPNDVAAGLYRTP